MAFDQEVRSYLEGLELAAPVRERVRHRRIDEAQLRAHLRSRLRELEQREPEQVGLLFELWSRGLTRLARYLELLPAADAPVVEADALAFACRVVDTALGLRLESEVESLELRRLLAEFEDRKRDQAATYALENRLVYRDGSGGAATSKLASAFLRLRGKDAVRWLLTVEVAQSTGPWDSWRAPRELLAEAASARGIAGRLDWFDQWTYGFNDATLMRLASMHVLVGEGGAPDEPPNRYVVRPSMRDVVQSVLEPGPWHAAVAALLEDERAAALPIAAPRATDAAIEQTRLIAHEVRNALVPVRVNLDALLRRADEEHRARLDRSRRGVVRVLEFVDAMVATAELVSEPAAHVDVGDLVREVAGWHEGGERVELQLGADPARVWAPPGRLRHAISNVVLNALQATEGGQRVRVSARTLEAHVELAVDDAGAGVPDSERTAIFRDGYTRRPAGSGFGLAFARRVVEEELRGKLSCESSELGGARFVMTIPRDEARR